MANIETLLRQYEGFLKALVSEKNEKGFSMNPYENLYMQRATFKANEIVAEVPFGIDEYALRNALETMLSRYEQLLN